MPMHISLIAPTICGILQPASSANTFIVVACCNVVKGSLINSDDTWFNSHVASWTIFITVHFSTLNTLLIVRLTLPNEKLYSATGNHFTIVIAFINFVIIFSMPGQIMFSKYPSVRGPILNSFCQISLTKMPLHCILSSSESIFRVFVNNGNLTLVFAMKFDWIKCYFISIIDFNLVFEINRFYSYEYFENRLGEVTSFCYPF